VSLDNLSPTKVGDKVGDMADIGLLGWHTVTRPLRYADGLRTANRIAHSYFS